MTATDTRIQASVRDPESPPAEKLRVVIIDDTPDLRELLGLALRRRKSFEVVGEAGDGARGIDVVRSTRPDVVVLDLAMPVMDGLEALPAIKQLVPEAVVVVLSGFGADALTEQALVRGAHDYLQKGTPLFDIVDRILELSVLHGLREPSHPATMDEDVTAPTAAPSPTVVAGKTQQSPAADLGTHMPPMPPDIDPTNLLTGLGAATLILTSEPDPVVMWFNRAADELWAGRLTVGARLAAHSPDLARLSHVEDDAGPTVFDAAVGHPAEPGTAMVTRQDNHVVVLAHCAATDSDSHRLRRAIATTAHEIRNPVTVLSGVVEAFGDPDLPLGYQRRLLESVQRQAGLLESITADLLTAAQADRGTLRVEPRPTDVESALREILAPHPDVRLVSARPARMLADPYRLEQMVSNLVSNARKYGASPIVVKVDATDHEVSIAVEDSGDGVSEDFWDQLFDEFTRAEGTQARGTGLGLFVVKQLAEIQGGSVAYRPSVLGGARFTITMPAA